jgi:hypothetical protein
MSVILLKGLNNMLYVFEYPERAIQRLKRLWIKTAFLVTLTLFDLYLALAFTIEQEVTQIARVFLPFLIFYGVAMCISAVSDTNKVRVVPILEQQKQGVSPYEISNLALLFNKDKKRGKAIARLYKSLVRLADNNSLLTLADFGQASVFDELLGKKIMYYDPLPAISAINRLLQYLEESKQPIKNKDAVISELQIVLGVLQEASENGLKFCFAIM